MVGAQVLSVLFLRKKIHWSAQSTKALVSFVHKTFSYILLERLLLFVDLQIGKYQCSFWRGKSTIYYIFWLNSWKDLVIWYWHSILFIDFCAVFDGVRREKLLEVMEELGIPSKLIFLVKATLSNSRARIQVQEELYGELSIHKSSAGGLTFRPAWVQAWEDTFSSGLLSFGICRWYCYPFEISCSFGGSFLSFWIGSRGFPSKHKPAKNQIYAFLRKHVSGYLQYHLRHFKFWISTLFEIPRIRNCQNNILPEIKKNCKFHLPFNLLWVKKYF